MDWKTVRDKVTKAAEAIELTPPSEVVRLYRHQIVPSGMGTAGQAFTTMVFSAGDMRCLGAYVLWPIARLVDDPDFSLVHLKKMFRETVPISAEFLGTCGLETLWALTREVLGVLDEVKTKEEFRELIEAYSFYATILYNWVHLYFPWYVGELFPQRKAADVAEMAKMLSLKS